MAINIFEHIYIINLVSRSDRRAEMEDQLRRIGLSLASDNIELFPAVRPTEACGFPSIGARGCFMSHLGILRDAKKRGFKKVLILEDDFDFSRDFSQRFKTIELHLQKSPWDIFYGGSLNQQGSDQLSGAGDIFVINPKAGIMGSHCIGLNSKAIEKLIAYFEAILNRPPGHADGGPMHVDGAYSWFRSQHPEIVTLIAAPEIGHQRSSATDVHQRKWFDGFPLTGFLISIIRRLKNRFAFYH
ncbi:MAG: glycosyltransferase family 25 protein [Verrucomicrobiota bacterium]